MTDAAAETSEVVGAPRNRRLLFVDVLNIIACVAVVTLHCSESVFAPRPGWAWVSAAFHQAFFIWAVPIYFMISGMNLLGYRSKYSTKTFFKKRLARVGIALLMGSIISYLFFTLFARMNIPVAKSYETGRGRFGVVDFLIRFLTNDVNDTYWFLYVLIYLYLLTPLLSLVARNEKIMKYLIGLCLFSSILTPLFQTVALHGDNTTLAIFNWPLFGSESLLYYLLGYYASRYLHKLNRRMLVAAFLCSCLAASLLTLAFNGTFRPDGMQLGMKYVSYFASIRCPFCVICSLSLFLLARDLEEDFVSLPERIKRAFLTLSSLTLDIYLFHRLVMLPAFALLPAGMVHVMRLVPLLSAVGIYAATALIMWAVLATRNGFMKAIRQRSR